MSDNNKNNKQEFVQAIEDAPNEGKNEAGEPVADSTESAGVGTAWESSGDLNATNRGPQPPGYGSGPGEFQSDPSTPAETGDDGSNSAKSG